MAQLSELIVVIKGARELANGIARKLSQCYFKVCMTEIPEPQAIRRGVAFCEAVYQEEKEVEGTIAWLISSRDEISPTWQESKLPLLIDPEAKVKDILKPDVLVDTIIAKKNLRTKITDVALVIGLGIGFQASQDVHVVIEINRGHNLGRVILQGETELNTEVLGAIAGISAERVLRAPRAGRFVTDKKIAVFVQVDEMVAFVDGAPVNTLVSGITRGLLRDGTEVHKGIKAGDVDPRGIKEHCYTLSDKAGEIAGGVLEAVLMRFNV